MVKEECKNCLKFKKGYCTGTSERQKGLICVKKFSNGAKYRAVKRSKKC